MSAPSTLDVVCESSKALPLVSVGVAAYTGALEDAPERAGLTRLTARLMRRTGGGALPHELDTRIDTLGGSLAVDVSTSTFGLHGTVIVRSLEAFTDVIVDVLARPGFAEDELGRLRRETEADLIEARDDDRTLARRWFRRKLFEGHPYAQSASGTPATLRAITRDDLVAQHRELLVAGNLCFAFSGDIAAERARGIAERIRAALPAGARRVDRVPEPERRPGRGLVIVDKPERTQTQILIGGLGTHPHDADHVALHVANTIFGGTFTARMTREIRSKRGWSYGAYSSLPIDRRRQAFSMWTFPKAEDAASCISVELDLLRDWVEGGVTQDELGWAKSYLVRSHAFSVDTASKRASLRLDETLYELPDGYHSRYVDQVRGVTLSQANAAIRQRISLDDLLVTVVGTESVIGDAVRKSIPRLSRVEVVPYTED